MYVIRIDRFLIYLLMLLSIALLMTIQKIETLSSIKLWMLILIEWLCAVTCIYGGIQFAFCLLYILISNIMVLTLACEREKLSLFTLPANETRRTYWFLFMYIDTGSRTIGKYKGTRSRSWAPTAHNRGKEDFAGEVYSERNTGQ